MPRISPDEVETSLEAGTTSARDISRTLKVSQATVSRLTAELVRRNRILRIGAARSARYALRHDVRGIGSGWPLYLIDTEGTPHELGTLYALAADQFCVRTNQAKKGRPALNGLSDGIPYFLQDQKPAGFLGRQVPALYPELQLPQRTMDWHDDHYLIYLTQRGSDPLGNLVLGTAALNRYLARPEGLAAIPATERAKRYPDLAAAAMAGGWPGSSAHGEHPKFTALLRHDHADIQVLVKFSPPIDTVVGRRWSDLLIAEHHAHVLLESAGVRACRSQVLLGPERTFLEVERFDRVGASGRVGVTSLFAIDSCFYGQMDHWIAAAERLAADRRIDANDLQHIRLLSAFGALILNNDRHFGNLAFFDNYDGRFVLAPMYDMLPMLFAPQHDQIPTRRFEPARADAQTLAVWSQARALAQQYWQRLADDNRISSAFREIAAQAKPSGHNYAG